MNFSYSKSAINPFNFSTMRFVYVLIGSLLFSLSSWAQPTLVAPVNNSIESNLDVYFDWSTVVGSSQYRIQVADATTSFVNATGFSNPIQNQNTGSNTSVTFTFEGGRSYAWAVKGTNPGYSNRQYFLVRHSAPTLIAPNGTVQSNNVDFSWNNVLNADQYRIQISTSSATNADAHDFTNPDIYNQNIGNLTSKSLTLPNLVPGVTYYWHVRGGNNIVGGVYSETWSFSLTNLTDCNGFSADVVTTPDNGTGDGTAKATVNGGASPYSFSWDNGETVSSITNLSAAQYCVTATDANGCTANACGEVTAQIGPLSINIDLAHATCAENGTATISVTGGSGTDYQIHWSDGFDGIFERTNLAAGNYSFTVTDSDPQVNPVSKTFYLEDQNQPPTVSIEQTIDPTTNTPTELFTNPDNFDAYKWFKNGVEVSSEAQLSLLNLSAGSYTFTVSVIDNCQQEAKAEINIDIQALRLEGTAQPIDATCPQNGEVSIQMTNPPSDLIFSWSDGQTGNPRLGLAAGTYAVTVSAPNYEPLVLDQIIVADSYSPLTFEIQQHSGSTVNERIFSTNPANSGVIEWRLDDVTSDVLGSEQEFVHEFTIGSHTIFAKITDDCGETLTKEMSITIGGTTNELVVNSNITPETCRENDNGNGSITLQIEGGSGQNTITWDGLTDTSNSLTGLLAGTYRYTVTDADPSVSAVSGTLTIADERPTVVLEIQSVRTGQTRDYTFSVALNTDLTALVWTVDGVTVATTPSFLHTFSTDGSYTVKLMATHRCGKIIENQIVVVVSNSGGNLTAYSLVCRNPEGTPSHIAIFDFETPANTSAKITFGDGLEQNLATQMGNINHEFQYAGVYYVILWVNNVAVDTATVAVNTSCGWASFVGGIGFTGVATPPLCDNIINGIFHIEPSRISESYYWTTLHRVHHFSVNGDNASFEVRTKNPLNEGGISCNDFSIGISGSKSPAHVSFMTTGCSFYANLAAGHSARSQVEELALDLEEWHIYKIQTENHVFKVYYDGVMIYSMPYEGDIGEIQGISVNFKGTGSVDFMELKENSAATPALREDFTTCQNGQRSLVLVEETKTICAGQTVLFKNQNLSQSGIYRDTISGISCFDTARVLYLTVMPPVKSVQNITIRQGDSLVLNGRTHYTTSVITDILSTLNGCDSVLETHLTVIACNLSVQIQKQGNTLRAIIQNASPQYNILWTLPNGLTKTSEIIDVTVSGVFKLKITDVFGCEAMAQIEAQREGYSIGDGILGCGQESLWLPVILKKYDNDLAGSIVTLRFDSTQFKPTGRTRLTPTTDNCLINNSINSNEASFLLYLNRANPIVGNIGDTLFLIEVKPMSSFLRQNATATMTWAIDEDHFNTISESFNGATTMRVEGTTTVAFGCIFIGTTELRRDPNIPVIYLGETCNSFTDSVILDATRKGTKNSPMPFYQVTQRNCDVLDRLIETSQDVYLASQIALANRSFIPTCYQMWAADADCNGKISSKDITLLQQRLIGLLDSGFLMPDNSHKTRYFFPEKMMAQRNWHISTRYPDADTEGGMTRLNIPTLNENCFKLDNLARCDTSNEIVVDIRIGDLDGSTTTVMLRNSGILIANVCDRKISGDTVFIPVTTPQYATSFDVFVDGQTPFTGIKEAENGIMQLKSNATNKSFNISGYSSVNGGIAAKQPLFYLTMRYTGDSMMTQFNTNQVLLNGQTATFKMVNEGCVNTEKITNKPLRVYPNPTSDLLTVDYPVGLKGQLSLVDAIGRQIANWQTDGGGNMMVDLSDIAQGVYILKLSDGTFQKVVKQ